MSKYYIARDKDNTLWGHHKEPSKGKYGWNSDYKVFAIDDENTFPEVKWTDDNPKVLTIEESPWIKVEDRLPPVYEVVLCLCRYNTGTKAYFHFLNSIDKDNNWTMKCLASYDVIAWMPIPEFKE